MSNLFQNRRWLVIPSSEVENINFNEVQEFDQGSLRYSLDGSKTFVKYDITIIEEDQIHTIMNPESMVEETYTTKAGVYGRPSIWQEGMTEYTHAQILDLLATPDWSEPINLEDPS